MSTSEAIVTFYLSLT